MKRLVILLFTLILIASCLTHVFAEGVSIKMGDSSNIVLSFQKALCMLGYLSKNDETGKYDSKTELAVIAYQIDNTIIPSGEIDLETQKSIMASVKSKASNINLKTEMQSDLKTNDEKSVEQAFDSAEPEHKEDETTKTLDDEKSKYIFECKTAEYEDIERNPNRHKGEKVHVAGKVIQVSEGWFNTVTMRVDQGGSKIWYMTYRRTDDNESRILEGDYVNFYGECEGVESYISVLGGKITIPSLAVKYYE